MNANSMQPERALCALVLVPLLSGGVANAQAAADAVPAATALEEIIVTSRKRDERLLDIPDSIFVLGSAQIEIANVDSLRSFVDLTPNLFVRETFRPNETFLTMRGLASAQGALPPVAFVVDGVQLGSNDFVNQDLFDIERIEVLRGPQGALYGQGAIAGAISIVTRQPTNELEGFAKGSYGSGNSTRMAAALSGPLLEDRLFARVSGYYKEGDGLIENVRGEDIDSFEESSARALLIYRGDRLEVQLRGAYTSGNASCCMLDRVPVDASGNLVGIDDVTNPGASSNILGRTDDELKDASLKVDYDFGAFTLTSITGYADVSQWMFGDGDYTDAPITAQDITFATTVTNQELRLTSNGDGRFGWMIGGFLQEREEDQDITVGTDGGAETIVAPIVLRQRNLINSDSWAVFGQLSYELTDRLQLTAAARYDRDEQDSRNRLNVAATFKEATFSEFQPKLQLGYRWTDDFRVYAGYSRGFRTGGFTQNEQFDNELTDNYEVGFKATLLDDSVSINGSVFHIDYSNQQISFVIFTPTSAQRGVVNVPATDIDGLELELAARPTHQLTLAAGFGMADSVIRKVSPNALFGNDIVRLVGNKSPLVPSFTLNASATWHQPVGALQLVFHGDYRRVGGFSHDAQNTIRTGSTNQLGVKVALEADRWSVGAWGRNVTDERFATYVSPAGSRLRGPNQPRSYGLEAQVRF